MALGAVANSWTMDLLKPNLLIIHTDEHHFATLGCYRDTLTPEQAFVWGKDAIVTTPHIDSLAKEGALSTKFYATTPVCSPSRGSFISGRYPQHTPVTTNGIPLDDGVISFAELCKRQGYTTGYSGKWHLDGQGKPQWGPTRQFGFDDNRFMFNRGHWKQFEDTPEGPRVKARNDKDQPTYDVKGADEKSFQIDWLTNKTIDFINKNKSRPFCYMCSIPDPHGPNTVRAPYDTMFDDMTIETPRTFSKEGDIPSWASKQKKTFAGAYIQKYFGMVKCIDDNVGRILDVLRDAKILDNTIVVFTSDHGDLCGQHARDNKGVPLEGSAKVPFIVRYPAKVKAGAIVTQALGCVDFLPTMMSMMNVKTAGLEEGRDASAFLMGKQVKGWDDIVFSRQTGKGDSMGWLAAITPRYKFIVSPSDAPWLLDLDKDGDELINFATDPKYRETVRELATRMRAYAKEYDDIYVDSPMAKAGIEWAINGKGAIVAPEKPATAAKGKARKK